MERTPTFLAALASAGVPGLDPVSVEALPSVPDQDYDVAFVQDTEHRRWVVRAPRSEAAGARMDLTVTLLQMLTRRLPFTVPAPRGFVELKGGGRAMIYPYLPGHNLDFAELPSGAGPAADLGRALAALHNTDARLFDEAGVPTYDADTHRTRRLADVDRAAQLGRVPTGLLTRWEKALEDVALWRFAATPIHGDLTGDQVLAVFETDADASTGRIRGITGWEDAKVADPADDFAALVIEASPEAVETVVEAYAHARVERPDANLLVRARLASELNLLAELMRADARGDDLAVDGLSQQLRRLDEEVHVAADTSDDYRRTSLTPVALRTRSVPPPAVSDDEDEGDDLDDVEFGSAESDTTEVTDAHPVNSETADVGETSETFDTDDDDTADAEAGSLGGAHGDVTDPLDSATSSSHDDEVAYTPRSFGSREPAAVDLEDDADDEGVEDPATDVTDQEPPRAER